MPHSLTTLSALERIAELAASPATAAERLRRILGAARDALGIDALAIASARDAFAGTPPGPSDGDPFVITLAPTNGYRVALVGFGGTPDTPHSPLLTVLASYVSVLLENERLARALESSDEQAARRIEEIAAIYEIGQAVDAADAQPILDVIVAKATAVMGAQACSLMLRDPIDGALTIRASWGLGDDVVKDARIEFGDAVAGRVAQTGEPMLITDLASDQRFAGVSPRSGITGSMCVPLRDEDGVVHGVLSIRRHEPDPPFGPDDLKLFSDLGLTLDVNGGPDTPAEVAKLAKELPDLTICINHCGNVRIDGKAPPTDWLAGMKGAAEHKHVFCKVSALVEGTGKREGDAPRDVSFYKPVLDALWTIWGGERLIYGSNWPVSVRAASYETVLAIVRDYFATQPRAIQEQFFAGNAQTAYRWKKR